MSLYLGCHQKEPPTFREGVTNSNNLIKQTLTEGPARQLGFQLVPDVEWTSKVSHHNWATQNMNSYLERRNEVNHLTCHSLRFPMLKP